MLGLRANVTFWTVRHLHQCCRTLTPLISKNIKLLIYSSYNSSLHETDRYLHKWFFFCKEFETRVCWTQNKLSLDTYGEEKANLNPRVWEIGFSLTDCYLSSNSQAIVLSHYTTTLSDMSSLKPLPDYTIPGLCVMWMSTHNYFFVEICLVLSWVDIMNSSVFQILLFPNFTSQLYRKKSFPLNTWCTKFLDWAIWVALKRMTCYVNTK